MKRYWIEIKWIDPNGNGVISEYTFKANTIKGARKTAEKAFWREKKVTWGGTKDIEIRGTETVPMESGLQNERTWRNPK